MNDRNNAKLAVGRRGPWDNGCHEMAYQYSERQSLSATTVERFQSLCTKLLRIADPRAGCALDILDVGCGAGTQARFWVQAGHRYRGIDINEPLIQLARRRARESGLAARFDVGSATELPCADASVDICLLPEVLEHVAPWRECLAEATRVLRPGGLLYISTSNKLCPMQQEFTLPLYSWYPGRLKRYFERRATSDWPQLANYAKYPAVNWFSFYDLRNHLAQKGFRCQDRFDLIDPAGKGRMPRAIIGAIRRLAPLRYLAHVATPYTVLVARKS